MDDAGVVDGPHGETNLDGESRGLDGTEASAAEEVGKGAALDQLQNGAGLAFG